MTACVSYLGPQPAEDILSPVLPDADVQSIAEGLNVFDILIPARNVTEEIQRRAAQFKYAVIEARA